MSEAVPEPRRLHPASLVSRSLRIVPQLLGGGAAYAAVVAREGLGRVLLFAAAAALVGIVGAFVIWWRFRYTVAANEIVIESGLLGRQRRVIPFDRVQDIAIERRLLARLFGTARVRIETGGAAADEGSLDMIALADAYALRDRIRRGGAATGAPAEAAAAEPVLFELKTGRLLYSGLFNFSLLFLAILFGALQYLDNFGLVDMEDWLDPKRADAAAAGVSPRAVAGLIVLLLLLGLVSGVARTVARDFGFRLTRSEAGLRRRRGLFTLSEVVIPLRRTQVALIESGPVSRRLGWHKLSFQTLGADRREGGVQVAAPFARMEELLPILAEAGFPPPPPRADFAGVPRRALIRRTLPVLLLAALAAAGAFALEPRAGLAAAFLLLLALAAALRWRRHAYALEGIALFVRDGLLRRRLWILPYARTQLIQTAAGPLQRPLRLATVHVDTAGASLIRAPAIVDLDAAGAAALAARLLAYYRAARAEARFPASV